MIIRCTALILGLLLLAAPLSASEPLSQRQKQRLISAVGKGLERKAFAWQTDFSSWPDQVARHQASIDSASGHSNVAAAVNQALDEFGLSHLRLYTPDEMAARGKGKTLGVGVKTVAMDDTRLVTLVLPDSPASDAGIQKGDRLIRVDGDPIGDGAALRGESGQRINVDWVRGNQQRSGTLAFANYRRALPQTLEWIDSSIAWITINSFARDQYDRDTVDDLFRLTAPASGLVIDLRSNGGGWSANVEHLMGHLVDTGTPLIGEVYAEDVRRRGRLGSLLDVAKASGNIVTLADEFAQDVFSGPLVVLTDGRSGSGADLFPAMIQDTGRGTVVGTRTAGVVLGGDWYKLPYGFQLLYPQAEIVRLNGTRLEGNGVTPDRVLSVAETADDRTIRNVSVAILRGADSGD